MDDFAEGENFEDLKLKSSIYKGKSCSRSVKTQKFSACGALRSAKNSINRLKLVSERAAGEKFWSIFSIQETPLPY